MHAAALSASRAQLHSRASLEHVSSWVWLADAGQVDSHAVSGQISSASTAFAQDSWHGSRSATQPPRLSNASPDGNRMSGPREVLATSVSMQAMQAWFVG